MADNSLFADPSDTPQAQTPVHPSFWHGLMAGIQSGAQKLNSGLENMPANPLYNVGLGLMSAAKPFGNVGDSLQQSQAGMLQNRAAMQDLMIKNYGLQQTKAMWPAYLAIAQKIAAKYGGQQPQQGGLMPPPQPAPQGGLMPPAGPTLGGAIAGAPPSGIPQGSPGIPQAPAQAPNPYAAQAPVNLPNAADDLDLGRAMATMKFPGAELYSPKALAEQQELLTKQRQAQVAPQIARLETIETAEDADRRLAADPQLKSLWDQRSSGAPLTPASARAFAGTIRNELAGSAQQAATPIPFQYQKVNRGNGDIRDRNPITLKDEGGAPAYATDKYIVNGKVVELPKAEGVRRGLTPYDTALYGADQITEGAKEQAYQFAKAKGDLTEPLAGRDPIAQAQLSSYFEKRGKEDGLTGLALAARKQGYEASQKVVNDYLDPNGKAGGKLTAINTITSHAAELTKLIDAMGTGNLTKINQAKIAYQRATGNAAPTNYEAMANLFSGEAATAITQAGGDAAERESIKAPFAGANSPQQIRGAIETTARAMAGKTKALRLGWDNGTGGSQGSFDKLLLPETRQFLSEPAAKGAPAIGTVSKGHRFLGGDPSKASSWQKVGG